MKQCAPTMTFELNIVHSRTPANIEVLLEALSELDAHFRIHPNRITPKASHLEADGHQLLMTRAGPLDVLAQIDGGRGYDDLLEWSTLIDFESSTYRVLSLEHLIGVKERAGRPKDLLAVTIIRHTLEEEE